MAQFVQRLAPAALNVPASHPVHDVAASAPDFDPAGQGVHDVFAVPVLKLPALQSKQVCPVGSGM